MFLMTYDLVFSDPKDKEKKKFTCPIHSAAWKRSVDTYSDSCNIKLPAAALMKKEGYDYSQVPNDLPFNEGMKVEFSCGYDHKNALRFVGFLRKKVFSVPAELEFEGYSYQLRQKNNYSKSYKHTTIKKILTDLVEGTDILLSDKIPDVPIPRAYFKKVNGTDVLEWIKEKCLLTIYFKLDVLYCGLRETGTKTQEKVNLRLGWNTIKDDGLNFDGRELATVNINMQSRNKDGSFEEITVGNDGKKTVTVKSTVINDPVWKKKIAEDVRKQLMNKGFEGGITTLLIPLAMPGMTADIDSRIYPQRNGLYFIDAVDGEFGPNGGRQNLKIGNYLGKN